MSLLCCLLTIAWPQDFRAVATVEKVNSASSLVVKFRDFRNYEDGRLVHRTIQLIGVSSPVAGQSGFKESVAWAKKRFQVGKNASGNQFPLGNGRYLGDLHIPTTIPGDDLNASRSVLLAGMGKFNPTLVPREYREPKADYQKWEDMMRGFQLSAERARVGLWRTAWRKKSNS